MSGSELSLKQLIDGLGFCMKSYIITGNESLYQGYKNICIVKGNNKLISWFSDLIKSIRYVVDVKPDKLYFNNSKSLILLFPLVILFFRKTIICHIRDNIKYRLLENILFFFCDKVICNSKYIYNQLSFKKKAIVIYNGVDTNLFSPSKKRNDAVKVVACISQMTPWKKIEDFIEVARLVNSKNSNVVFLIIGDVLNPKDEVYRKKLKELVSKYNLDDKIKFIGFYKKIQDYISNIDLLCHMATTEPFGKVIIEAMSCEKPVLAYEAGGALEIINNGIGVLIPEGEIRIFAKKLNGLLLNTPLRLRMGEKARIRVLNNFSEKLYISKIELLLRK